MHVTTLVILLNFRVPRDPRRLRRETKTEDISCCYLRPSRVSLLNFGAALFFSFSASFRARLFPRVHNILCIFFKFMLAYIPRRRAMYYFPFRVEQVFLLSLRGSENLIFAKVKKMLRCVQNISSRGESENSRTMNFFQEGAHQRAGF